MTPDERRLITDLFDRMRSFGGPEKDREAEALINQSVRAVPDAPYMLVQSVLVQEQALEAANGRVQELEERVRALEDGGSSRAQSSGSFLGGLFGTGRPAIPPRSSVPEIGSRATPYAYGNQPQGAQPGPQSQPPPQPAPAASGGFMRSALTTAAGVAGGMLLADSIRGMLGGHAQASQASGQATSGQGTHGTDALAGPASGQQDADRGYAEKAGYVDDNDNDPGSYASDDNDPGFDIGDIEI